MFREENEDIINAALSENDNMETVDISDYFEKETAKDGYVTLLPHVDGTDGFFICKLRKKK